MTGASYGELMDGAALALARVASTVRPARTVSELLGTGCGIERVRRAIARHARLTSAPGTTTEGAGAERMAALVEATSTPWLPADTVVGPIEATGPWFDVASLVGAAADLLATHLGPDGDSLTPDAALPARSGGRAALAHRSAELTATLADVAVHLARVAVDEPELAGARGEVRLVDRLLSVWFTRGVQAGTAARQVLDDQQLAGSRHVLDGVSTAPLLRPEPVESFPDALRAFDRLRRFAHAQRVGSAGADAASLRGYAALGHTVTGHAWVIHRALAERAAAIDPRAGELRRVHHELASELLDGAHRAWGQLAAELADVRVPDRAPTGWRQDLHGVRDQLARLTRDGEGFLPPDRLVPDRATASHLVGVCDRLLAGLTTVIDDQAKAAQALFQAGCLYVPTRLLDEEDIPRPFGPMPARLFVQVAAAYDGVRDKTSTLGTDLSAVTPEVPSALPMPEADRPAEIEPMQLVERSLAR